MSNLWVLVADSSKARFFQGISPHSELKEFHGMVNQEVRLKEHDLITDKPGRFKDERGNTRASNETNAKGHETDKFAKDITSYLEKFANQNKFKHLSIVAEPKMMGRLRNSLGNQTSQRVLEQVSKNLTTSDEQAIREHLERIPVQ